MSDISLEKLEVIVRGAGVIALQYFGKITDADRSIKDDGSLLTVADLAVNTYILDALRKEFPEYPILSEEVKGMPEGNSMWIVDPIDGTKNFSSGNPYFGISIGLIVDGVPEVGVVYSPAENKLYSAKRGSGAFLNGKKIAVSSCDSMQGAHILLDTGASEQTLRMHGAIREGCSNNGALVESKMAASLELCAVASGESDAMAHRGLKAWDIAGGMVVALEAGARITDLVGVEKDMFKGGIVVSTPHIHESIVEITAKVFATELARG